MWWFRVKYGIGTRKVSGVTFTLTKMVSYKEKLGWGDRERGVERVYVCVGGGVGE